MMAVSKTTNFGSTWTRYNIGGGTGRTYCLAIDPNNSNVVYAGGDESASGTIYKTTNGGSNWTKCTATGLGGAYVYSLAVDPDNSNVVYAGTSTGCYKSTNGGGSFANTSCPGGQTNAVLVNTGSAIYEGVYAGTETNGVYYSTNAGSSWTQINQGLSDLTVNCLSLSENMYVYAGTDDGGIHRWSIAIGSEEQIPGSQPRLAFYAVPNPVKARTVLHYSLPRTTHVNISIYDAQGRAIVTLTDDVQPAGAHSATWDVRDRTVPAGVYFCRLATETTILVEKLIIVH
jgi:photosystem II stability/assembly factor-like uncharacterized protein